MVLRDHHGDRIAAGHRGGAAGMGLGQLGELPGGEELQKARYSAGASPSATDFQNSNPVADIAGACAAASYGGTGNPTGIKPQRMPRSRPRLP